MRTSLLRLALPLFILSMVMFPVIALAGTPIVIKLGATAAGNLKHPEYAALMRFAEVAKQESKDQLRVDVYPANQLGSIKEMVEGAAMGTIQACNVGLDSISAVYPAISVLNMPYVFRDIPHVQRALASQAGQAVMDRMRREMKIRSVAVLYRGPRQTMNSARVVAKPSDLRGLKIRVPNSPLMLESLKAMGATPMPIDFSELYTALSQKVVDGVENPIDVLYEIKGHETMKFLSLTAHMQSPIPIFVGETFYTGLAPELQQAILKAGKAAEDYRLELLKTSEGDALKAFKAAGVQVADVDHAAFADATKNVYKQFSKMFSDETYQEILKVR
jgi:TRAP-type transport system periplasmic protein